MSVLQLVCLLPAVLAVPVPIVLWHGMGDSCCNPLSMGSIERLLEEHIPGVYVKSLRIGSSLTQDIKNGFFENTNTQVEDACQQLAQDPKLENGYNSVGFSQGGLFLRAVAQRCAAPTMKTLISVGGPQQGVYGFPHCPGDYWSFCNIVRKLLSYGAYSWVQSRLVQAQYWHSPVEEDVYREKSLFLADINCARACNNTYKENLSKLENLVLIKFSNDTMVQPKDSEWFGFYKPGQTNEVDSLEETELYIKNSLGLQEFVKTGRLHRLETEGDHLQIDTDWFVYNVINQFLK